MPRAILRDGVIHPLEPLPRDWQDGTELQVEKTPRPTNGQEPPPTDDWLKDFEANEAKIPRGEDEKLMQALAEIRVKAKSWLAEVSCVSPG